MTRKLRIIRGLLFVYPKEWRSQYGQELEALLLSRPLTAATACDVFLNGSKQRLRDAEPWAICGALLFLWTFVGIVWNSARPFSEAWYSRSCAAVWLFTIAAGYFTTWRTPCSLGKAASLSAQATLIGIVPEAFLCLLWAASIVHPTILDLNGLASHPGDRIAMFYMRGYIGTSPLQYLFLLLVLTTLQGWILGFAGAALGRLAGRFCVRIYRG